MITFNEYLNRLKEQHGLKNDAALCRAIHVQPPTISKVRSEISAATPYLILHLVEHLGVDIADMRKVVAPEEFSADAAA